MSSFRRGCKFCKWLANSNKKKIEQPRILMIPQYSFFKYIFLVSLIFCFCFFKYFSFLCVLKQNLWLIPLKCYMLIHYFNKMCFLKCFWLFCKFRSRKLYAENKMCTYVLYRTTMLTSTLLLIVLSCLVNIIPYNYN